jgi:hypothetical protein
MMAKVSRMCRFCSRVSEGLAETGSEGGASSVKDMGATRGLRAAVATSIAEQP